MWGEINTWRKEKASGKWICAICSRGSAARRPRIKVPTYLSCKHKQSDEEDEERDGAHGLQVFQNSRPQRSESDGESWRTGAGGDGKGQEQIKGDVTGVGREKGGDVGQRTFN